MLAAIGIDLVDVTRIARLMARHGERFLRRVLHAQELSHLATRYDRAQFVAGRFAAKEAAIKALGRYLSVRPALSQVYIVNDASGQPSLQFDASLRPLLVNVRPLLSISHERSHAIAIVILSEDQ